MYEAKKLFLGKSVYDHISHYSNEKLGILTRALFEWSLDPEANFSKDISEAFNDDNLFITFQSLCSEIAFDSEEAEKERARWTGTDRGLTMPFDSYEFADAWGMLLSSDEWKDRPQRQLQAVLNLLKKYDVKFATEIVRKATAGNWKSIIFDNTDDIYIEWCNKQASIKSKRNESGYWQTL